MMTARTAPRESGGVEERKSGRVEEWRRGGAEEQPVRTGSSTPPLLRSSPHPFPRSSVLPLAGVPAATLLLFSMRAHLDRAEAALVYLLVVVFSATLAGVGP